MDDVFGISVKQVHGADLGSAAEAEADWMLERLATTGAVLLRGARASGTAEFQHALRAVGFIPLQYTERSTPRSEVVDGVFTSTEYPAREVIPQHNESSYAAEWPGRLAFHCVSPALTGGATPIADVSAVLRDVPARIRAAVEKRGLRYVRNYGSGVGLDWRAAFQTRSRAAVEDYCRAKGMDFQWRDDECLRTIRQAPGLAVNPVTGADIWFNHLVLFHQSALRPEVRSALVGVLGEQNLPNDVFFGDGAPIPDDDVDAVRSAFARHTRRFDWERNDLLVIDNMWWSHGREAFTGKRRILVSMSDVVSARQPALAP